MNKRFAIILVVIIAGFIGIFALTKHKANAPSNGGTNKPAQLTSHIEGSTSSGVNFIEYGDYQCPACYQYFPIVQQVYAKYKTQITFQFRNFPLTEIHQYALLAARAAEAAGNQNKYWEMHDMLYVEQPTWSKSTTPTTYFEDYAKQLGLDVNKFRSDMQSDATNQAVQADRAEALRLGFTGTPSFVIDGKNVETTPRDIAGFSKLIDDAIAAKAKH